MILDIDTLYLHIEEYEQRSQVILNPIERGNNDSMKYILILIKS